jgi:DNA-binding response OmpR family regulator
MTGRPFLLATAEAGKENIIEVAQAGAGDYSVKPFTSATLKDKVEAMFKRKGAI